MRAFTVQIWLRFLRPVSFAATLFCIALVPCALAQCSGLHAGITAEIVPHHPGTTDTQYIQLTFLVVNDSNSARNVAAGSWKIIVNGTELADSDFIFGNGPAPVGGYNELKPGQNYQFGKGLPISTYFKKPGEYKVSWKADGFQSPTILIRVPAQ